jgi:D-xylulose reductase
LDVARVQAKELTFSSVFRYANMYPRAIDLIGSGRLDVQKLISAVYPFDLAVEAFDRAKEMRADDVKIQLEL